MSSWRIAGLKWDSEIDKVTHLYSYLQYSSAAAQFVRAALKPEFRAASLKRQDTTIKVRYWVDGKVTDTRLFSPVWHFLDRSRAPAVSQDRPPLACDCRSLSQLHIIDHIESSPWSPHGRQTGIFMSRKAIAVALLACVILTGTAVLYFEVGLFERCSSHDQGHSTLSRTPVEAGLNCQHTLGYHSL
jgi:hypothetical protein